MVDKMPQLDRIELRQRYYELENSYADKFRNISWAVYSSLFMLVILLVVDIWCALHGNGWFSSRSYVNFGFIIGFYMMVMLFLDLFNIVVYNKKLKEIYSDYFKEKVTLKRKK